MEPDNESPADGSCLSDPFADLPAALRPTGPEREAKRRRFGLRRVTCPGCGLTYTTNRDTDLCTDCERRGVRPPPQVLNEGASPDMLNVKVLGPGCAKCEFLEERARLALAEIKAEFPDVDAVVEKVTDVSVFMDYGLLVTPGLVINDKLVCAGKVASPNAIAGWMREALNSSA